jgi:hypothetical protein
VHIVVGQHILPDFRIRPVEQVPCLRAEHAVLIGDVDELEVVATLLVSDEGQVRVALLAVLSNSKGVVLVVLFQELLRVVVGILFD